MPEQASCRILWCSYLSSCVKVLLQRRHHTAGQGQDPRLEELRLTNGDRAGCQIDVAEIEACQLAQSQSCAIREHQHSVQRERTQGCPRGGIRASRVKEEPNLFRVINVGPPHLLRQQLT